MTAVIEHHHADVSGGWLRAATFGAMDGLVTNIALIAGVGGGGAGHRALLLTGAAGLVAGCASTSGGGEAKNAADGGSSKVAISLTSHGCAPSPTSVAAGPVDFAVENSGAGGVTEAELRTRDLAHILGEQENLTPGLSGGFSLTLNPGTYVVNCPGADQAHWPLTVTGESTATDPAATPALKAATAKAASTGSRVAA